MLTELCQYLKNWEFDLDECPKIIGTITVEGGVVSALNEQIDIKEGQYFRVIGSIFNDGVHLYPDNEMTDETFKGAVWLMSVPAEIVSLAQDIDDWKGKYETLNSQAMSPYNSESFGVYSYSKSGAGATASASSAGLSGWQSVFATRLNPWRKI